MPKKKKQADPAVTQNGPSDLVIPVPEFMKKKTNSDFSITDIPEIIDYFMLCVKSYIFYYDLCIKQGKPTVGSSKYTDLLVLKKKTFKCSYLMKETGRILSTLMETLGYKSESVLRVLHCEEIGGEGFEGLRRIWPECKLSLHRLMIQLSTDKKDILTDLQTRIMEELHSTGMTAKKIEKRIGSSDGPTINTIRKALKELKLMGKIENRRGLGYFRPDAPPKPLTD